MNRLWGRLTLAFVLVAVLGFGTAAVLVNQQVASQFRGYLANSQVLSSGLLDQLTDFYARTGSWDGVETVLNDARGPGLGPGGMGQGRGLRRGAPSLILANAQGHIVYGDPGTLSQAELDSALPVTAQGRTVGYVLVQAPGRADVTGPAQVFLDRVQGAVAQAGLLAGAVGLLLGLLIARGLAAPLAEVANAARELAAGRRDHRVRERGTDEVRTVARAFNELAADLDQAETLRRNLVADIAHELRTPLTVIQGNLQAILDDVYPLDKNEITTLYDETLVLSRLITDLRELAQAEAGQLALHPQPTDIGQLVEGEVARFAEQAEARTIKLTAATPGPLPLVPADPDRVRQVLHNLLTNALQHTPAGGQIIVAAATVEGQAVRVTVSDTGSGIAPDDLPHVFDRFWRADRSRSREGGGSGLGLAIARQLVEAHDGQIGVDSRLGSGSQFWFILPKETPDDTNSTLWPHGPPEHADDLRGGGAEPGQPGRRGPHAGGPAGEWRQSH